MPDDQRSPSARLWLFLPPFALLAGTALYLQLNWDRIPERFPIHWDLNGVANGFSNRDASGVFLPLLIGFGVLGVLLASYALVTWGARPSSQQAPTQFILILVAYVIAITFAMAALLPLRTFPAWTIVAIQPLFLLIIGIGVWRHFRTGESNPATPDDCWRWRIIYSNPADPAIFVEKRVGIGYTLNFGNPLSWLVLLAFLGFPALIAGLLHFTSK